MVPLPTLLSRIIISPAFEVSRKFSIASCTNLFDGIFSSGIGVWTDIIPILGSSDFIGEVTNSRFVFLRQLMNSFFR